MCHFYLNEMDEAAALLERVLTLAPGNGFALYVRSQLRTQTAANNNVEHLRSTLMRPQIRRQDAISTYFALAKELEDIGEYQESFAALSEGNRIKRSTLAYDVRNDVDAMQKVMTHFSREALAQAAPGEPAAGPIFIVGMPRTGTTLVERILGSHADVVSLGELVDFPAEMTALAERAYVSTGSTDPDLLRASLQMDFAELGRNYLKAVQPLAGGHKYFVDKLPFNFRYCGLIHQALPNAKIVHLTRDPLDTCYAVFKTLFINAYHYSYQLDELAQFYVAYRRTMAHWHAVMPGVICDVSYEDLVADPPRSAAGCWTGAACRGRTTCWISIGRAWLRRRPVRHRYASRSTRRPCRNGAISRSSCSPWCDGLRKRAWSTRRATHCRRHDPADESARGSQALPSTGRLRIHCDKTHLTPRVGGRPACSES